MSYVQNAVKYQCEVCSEHCQTSKTDGLTKLGKEYDYSSTKFHLGCLRILAKYASVSRSATYLRQ